MQRLSERFGSLWRSAPSGRLRAAESEGAEKKASRVGPLIAYDTLGQPVWSPRDYGAFAREGFMQNAIVYRSVRMIAEAAASIPLLLYAGSEEIETHPLLDLIRKPSADHTGPDFLEAWFGFLLVSGNAYVEAVAVDGQIRELHNLRPDRMKVLPGLDSWPEGYEYTAGGKSVRFMHEPVEGVRPVLHTRLFHPVNDHYGMSPIEAAATAIDIHNTASGWNKALLDNSARPSGALVYAASNGQMTDEQFARLKSELEGNYQGAAHAGRPLLLEGGLDWKPLSLSPKDMDFIEAKNAAAREIALAIGVPPMLLGIPGDNTFANYAEAQRAFWRQTVLPLVNRMCAAFSVWLSPAFAGRLDEAESANANARLRRPEGAGAPLALCADLDQVEALNPEREALWARLQNVTFLTDDEKRAAAGYAALSIAPSDSRSASRPEGAGALRVSRARPLGNPFVGEGAGASDTPSAKYRDDQPRVPAGNADGGQWTDDAGGSGEGGDGYGRIRIAQADIEPEQSVDLRAEDETLGGHAYRRHVNRSDDELLDVVRRDRVVGLFVTIARRAQGSFFSLEDGNNLVNQTLRQNEVEVGLVANGAKMHAEFVKRFGYVTGKEAFRADADAEPYMRPTYEVFVLIEHDRRSKKGYRVFTAYPRNAMASDKKE